MSVDQRNTLRTSDLSIDPYSKRLRIDLGNSDSFGTMKVCNDSHIFSGYFLYGIVNPYLFQTFTASGGTVTTDTDDRNTVELSCSASVGSYSLIRSRTVLKYHHGSTFTVIFSAEFDANAVANSLQFAGVGTSLSDLYFCYTGTQFGVRRSTKGHLEKRNFTVTAAATGAEVAVVTLNSVPHNVNLTNAGGDLNFTAYEIAEGTFPGWDVYALGTEVFFVSTSAAPLNGTYSFTSATATVSAFTQLRSGQTLQTTFYPLTGLFVDPTIMNLYRIQYSWFGKTTIEFAIYNPDINVKKFETVKSLEFVHTNEYSISSPNMYIQLGCASLGSAQPLTVRSSGCSSSESAPIPLDLLPTIGLNIDKSILAGVETNIVAISLRPVIGASVNQSDAFLRSLSVASDGTKNVQYRIILNPTSLSAGTTADYVKWTSLTTESLLKYDSNSITHSGGTIVSTFTTSKTGSQIINFGNNIRIRRTDVLVFVALSTNASIIDLSLTFNINY